MDDKQEIKEAFATFLSHPCKKTSYTTLICILIHIIFSADLYLYTYVFFIYSAIIIKIYLNEVIVKLQSHVLKFIVCRINYSNIRNYYKVWFINKNLVYYIFTYIHTTFYIYLNIISFFLSIVTNSTLMGHWSQ